MLIETNQALQQHAQAVAQIADNLDDTWKGVMRMTRQLSNFADYRPSDEEED